MKQLLLEAFLLGRSGRVACPAALRPMRAFLAWAALTLAIFAGFLALDMLTAALIALRGDQ